MIIVLVGLAAFAGYRSYILSGELASTSSNLASTTASLQQTTDAYASEQAKTEQLKAELAQAQQENGNFSQEIGQISSTVGSLSKLASLDPELLEKYSKVFFLSDNYIPAKLSDIDPDLIYGKKTIQFESDALPFLVSMMDAANTAGNNLRVVSGYRSFGTQSNLKTTYKVTYGAGTANSFSADQGYSEHQLGTTIDFTNTTLGDNFTPFDKTTEYTWLIEHAYQYGFILSYPKGNAFYVYEPWHWRFVGVKLATMLHVENQEFYQLDQRSINPYLISIFDPIAS